MDEPRFAIDTDLGINAEGGYIQGFMTYEDESLNIYHFNLEQVRQDSPYLQSCKLINGEIVFDQEKYDEYMDLIENSISVEEAYDILMGEAEDE